jgi:hypothetical protein
VTHQTRHRALIALVALAMFGCIGLNGQTAAPKRLPAGIYSALASDETAYCAQFLGSFKKGCRQTFRANLIWREIEVSPTQSAILIELHDVLGQCGSAGCTLYIFLQRQPTGTYIQVLGTHGEVGDLARISVLKTTTKGHYDVQKTWHDGNTHTVYKWNGLRYVAV